VCSSTATAPLSSNPPSSVPAWEFADGTVAVLEPGGNTADWRKAVANEHAPKRVEFVTTAPAGPSSFDVATEAGLAAHIETINRRNSGFLVEQLRSPLGVMPFVGAGLSAPFKFPMWDPFLRASAVELQLPDVVELLDRQAYDVAAERLSELGGERFNDQLMAAFGRTVDPLDLQAAPLPYLPLLTSGPVITTNFDTVLEQAFKVLGHPFEDVVAGPQEDLTVAAIHRNRRVLLKLHGTFKERHFRVFTQGEYTESYERPAGNLTDLAWLTFTNRPLLFLGSSLIVDRTVKVVEEIHRRLRALQHYAVLSANYTQHRQQVRERELTGWGIRPLFYLPEQHHEIETLLADLVERAGTRAERSVPRAAATSVDRGERFALTPVIATATDVHVRTIARTLADGELAFFLGAGAHLQQFVLGDALYSAMAAHFGCPELSGDRSAVAAFVADRRGTATLWDWVRDTLDRPVPLGAVYEFLVALPGVLRARKKGPLWVFTTNYDAVLERGLIAAGEPFHVLYYLEPQGHFAHTAPDGTVRVIERPEAVRRLAPEATVVVKLNGGIADGGSPKESVVIATAQFERLAESLPDSLPACVRAALHRHRLLFLGHGLNEPDSQKILRVATRDHKPAWLVRRRPARAVPGGEWDQRADDFARLGATTLARELDTFIDALRAELAILV
jgi:SIR2-like domain